MAEPVVEINIPGGRQVAIGDAFSLNSNQYIKYIYIGTNPHPPNSSKFLMVDSTPPVNGQSNNEEFMMVANLKNGTINARTTYCCTRQLPPEYDPERGIFRSVQGGKKRKSIKRKNKKNKRRRTNRKR
jgi:hypothetical protein